MTTRLDKPLKRELSIRRRPYIVTLSPDGLKLTEKGRRKGQELRWEDLVSGEAALAVALNASLKNAPTQPEDGSPRAASRASKSSASKSTAKTSAAR